jgi:hypothetical protein
MGRSRLWFGNQFTPEWAGFHARIVMAGLVPAIHVFFTVNYKEDVDARDIWREDALSRFCAGMTKLGHLGG